MRTHAGHAGRLTPRSRKGLPAALLLAALALVAGACSSGSGDAQPVGEMVDTGNEESVEHVPSADEVSVETAGLPTPPREPSTPNKGKGSAADAGDFVAVYEPLSNRAAYGQLEGIFRNARLLESLAEELNGELSLTSDVILSFRECGMINAFYEPSKRRVSMCYEYVDFFQHLFMQSGGSTEDAASGIKGAIYYTLYHEIGHALIDTLDLPVTGREEDVVDQLSTYILVEKGGPEGEEMALNGARFWYLLSRRNQQMGQGQDYWEEHSTNEQRFFNSICWLYGSNPQKYEYLVSRDSSYNYATLIGALLPTSRAERCPNEYSRFVKGWRNALAPYSKH